MDRICGDSPPFEDLLARERIDREIIDREMIRWMTWGLDGADRVEL
jgi:hypothetical protein